jgi:GGDEF domain-containing protein
VIVLPGHPQEAIENKIRNLSEIAVQAGRLHCGEDLLSMSVGAAVFPQDGMDAEQLLAEADRRMYHAKREHAHTAELDGSRDRARRGLALVS